MFLNYSNHPSDNWNIKQINEAQKYGEIVDLSFPAVDPYLDKEEIEALANNELDKILSYKPDVVLCQGEFTLSYVLINKLKEKNIKVIAACSERNVVQEDNKKIVLFEFVKFREY